MDLNYLDHEFKLYEKYGCDDFKCIKCGVIVWLSDKTNRCHIVMDDHISGILILTCKEQIIKNIIE